MPLVPSSSPPAIGTHWWERFINGCASWYVGSGGGNCGQGIQLHSYDGSIHFLVLDGTGPHATIAGDDVCLNVCLDGVWYTWNALFHYYESSALTPGPKRTLTLTPWGPSGPSFMLRQDGAVLDFGAIDAYVPLSSIPGFGAPHGATMAASTKKA